MSKIILTNEPLVYKFVALLHDTTWCILRSNHKYRCKTEHVDSKEFPAEHLQSGMTPTILTFSKLSSERSGTGANIILTPPHCYFPLRNLV